MRVLAVVESAKVGENQDGSPIMEAILPALLRLDVPEALATPGQKAYVLVLVRVQAPAG